MFADKVLNHNIAYSVEVVPCFLPGDIFVWEQIF